MNNYEEMVSMEGIAKNIRELDPGNKDYLTSTAKGFSDTVEYIKKLGDGRILVVNDMFRFYAEEGKGVYAFISKFSLEWLVSSAFKDRVEELRNIQEENFENENYEAYFENIAVPMRMHEFEKVYKQIQPHEIVGTWLELYASANYNANHLKKSVFNYLCKYRKRFDSDEEIVIYRGEADESQSYEKTLSWTTDLNVAIFFATRYGEGQRILKAKVKRKDILFEYNGRDEFEIIVKPENVYDVEHMDFYNATEFLKASKLAKVNSYCISKMKLMFELYPEDSWHDVKHIIRVTVIAKVIADELKMNEEDMALAILCAVYHDSGRINDGADPEHGKRSAEIFATRESLSDEDMAIAATVIEYHCLDDMEGEKAIEENKCIIDKDRALKIYHVLKDADALDRLRFGRGLSGLKYEMLRLPESKRCTLIAGYCNNEEYLKILMYLYKRG